MGTHTLGGDTAGAIGPVVVAKPGDPAVLLATSTATTPSGRTRSASSARPTGEPRGDRRTRRSIRAILHGPARGLLGRAGEHALDRGPGRVAAGDLRRARPAAQRPGDVQQRHRRDLGQPLGRRRLHLVEHGSRSTSPGINGQLDPERAAAGLRPARATSWRWSTSARATPPPIAAAARARTRSGWPGRTTTASAGSRRSWSRARPRAGGGRRCPAAGRSSPTGTAGRTVATTSCPPADAAHLLGAGARRRHRHRPGVRRRRRGPPAAGRRRRARRRRPSARGRRLELADRASSRRSAPRRPSTAASTTALRRWPSREPTTSSGPGSPPRRAATFGRVDLAFLQDAGSNTVLARTTSSDTPPTAGAGETWSTPVRVQANATSLATTATSSPQGWLGIAASPDRHAPRLDRRARPAARTTSPTSTATRCCTARSRRAWPRPR